MKEEIESLEQNNLTLSKLGNRLVKQKKNPYFGRFDFKADSEAEPKVTISALGI